MTDTDDIDAWSDFSLLGTLQEVCSGAEEMRS